MKSIAELEAIRQRTLEQVNLRREHADASHVVVGMGESGIEAGAREVVKAFLAETGKQNLLNVTIAQKDGLAQGREPLVEVACPGAEKVLYEGVKPEMVERIVTEHIMGGKPVADCIAK